MGINTYKKAFSFIEMIVVIGVIALILPLVFSIFFIILREQTNLLQLTEVRRQGVFLSDLLTTLTRNNAIGIYLADKTTQVCSYSSSNINKSSSGVTLYFKDKNSNWIYFDSSSNKVASVSSIPNANADLTGNSKVLVTSFSSQCSTTSFSTPIVVYSYDICYKSSSGPPCSSKILHFQPTVKLRNY